MAVENIRMEQFSCGLIEICISMKHVINHKSMKVFLSQAFPFYKSLSTQINIFHMTNYKTFHYDIYSPLMWCINFKLIKKKT